MQMISRRSFLKGTGAVAGALALTACGGSASSSVAASTPVDEANPVLAQFDDAVAALADWQGSYDALIQQIYVETDLAKRTAMMHQAEDVLMSTWAVVPVTFYTDLYLQQPTMTDLYTCSTGMKRFYYAHNTKNGDASLNVNLASEPDYLDPARSSSVDGGCMACNLFLGLMNQDKTGAPIPGCAESYTVSEDGSVYTFQLREGMKWSNGDKLDANDFAYSWNRAADPATEADYSYLFDAIARKEDGTLDVTVSEDGLTLTVVLASVCPYFLDLAAFPTFFPVHQASVEAAGSTAWALEAGFVSNGAYTLDKWDHNVSMTLNANPNFAFAADVTIPTVNFMLSADDTAIYTAFQNGDLDFAASCPSDEIGNLKGGDILHLDPYLGTYYIGINVKSDVVNAGRTPAQSCALRKALCLAVDREYFADAYQAGEIPANTFVSDGCADGNGGIFRANTAAYTFPVADKLGYFDTDVDANADEVQELLAAAGVNEENKFSFEYLTNESSKHKFFAQCFQQDLAGLGIDMTVAVEEWNTFLADRKQGNYDIAREGWVMDFNDPINELEMWLSYGGNNDCQFGR